MNKPTLIAVNSLNIPVELNSARRGAFGMGMAATQNGIPREQLQPLMDGDGNLNTPQAKEERATQARLQEMQQAQARENQQNDAQQAGAQQGNEDAQGGVEGIVQDTGSLSADQIKNLTLHSVTYRDTNGENTEINVDAPFLSGDNSAGPRSASFRLQAEGHIEDLQVNLLDDNTVVGNIFDAQRNSIMTGQSRITGFTLKA